ncbi:unnamed protein product [Acanthoscelides obtectus]|uniref:Uncharacterized protein n=1 Tax=Acanthoscelides obtectus TaxID=200917 RepID=A0A9P0PVP7_ACAOB|nr:unnamed protein product [Acanthoscelides obtectus]CAK1621977.1 hypothetical protein AOBTE_LOCUS1248 [Acanthoscelides obtectus]
MKRRQRVAYFSSFCAFTTARNHVFFKVTLLFSHLFTSVKLLQNICIQMVRNYVRKTDRGGWTEEQMKNAVLAVVENKMDY